MINARVRVKFAGGREMVGVLKGYDQLLNVVLDETVEYLRDAADATRVTDTTRGLGLVVCRGPNITCVCTLGWRARARFRGWRGARRRRARLARERRRDPYLSRLLLPRASAACSAPTTAWRRLQTRSRRRRNKEDCVAQQSLAVRAFISL
jgi:small nuclear ribonucleoprotein (snRNP)-like protein